MRGYFGGLHEFDHRGQKFLQLIRRTEAAQHQDGAPSWHGRSGSLFQCAMPRLLGASAWMPRLGSTAPAPYIRDIMICAWRRLERPLGHEPGRPHRSERVGVSQTRAGHARIYRAGPLPIPIATLRGRPPEKWSSLMYGFEPFGGLIDVEEAAHS
jgi:hypothetical protein